MALFGALKLKKAAKDRAKDQEQAKHCERVAQLLDEGSPVVPLPLPAATKETLQ